MDTVLALIVAAGFVWSVILFFAAVFMRERDQESGFLFSLLGAGLYLVVFCDRLPGSPTALRAPLQLLPGVSEADSLFVSPVWMLAVLVAVYALRILVFYELFFDLSDVDVDGDGTPDDINDLVAPVLSYLALGLCAVPALSGSYQLGAVATAAACVVWILLYWTPWILRFLRPYLDVAYEYLRSWIIIAGQRISDGVMLVIIGLGRAQLARRGKDTGAIDRRAAGRRKVSDERVMAARNRRRAAAARLASRARNSRQRRASGTESRDPNFR